MVDRNNVLPLFSVWFNKREGCVEYALHRDSCETIVRAEIRRNHPNEAMRDFAYLSNCASSTALNIEREVRGFRSVHPIDRLVMPKRNYPQHPRQPQRFNYGVPQSAPPTRAPRSGSRAGSGQEYSSRPPLNEPEYDGWGRSIVERQTRDHDRRDDRHDENRRQPAENRSRPKVSTWTQYDRHKTSTVERAQKDTATGRQQVSGGTKLSGFLRSKPHPHLNQPSIDTSQSENNCTLSRVEILEGKSFNDDRKSKEIESEKPDKKVKELETDRVPKQDEKQEEPKTESKMSVKSDRKEPEKELKKKAKSDRKDEPEKESKETVKSDRKELERELRKKAKSDTKEELEKEVKTVKSARKREPGKESRKLVKYFKDEEREVVRASKSKNKQAKEHMPRMMITRSARRRAEEESRSVSENESEEEEEEDDDDDGVSDEEESEESESESESSSEEEK